MFWDDKIKNFPLTDNLLNNFESVKKEVLTYINKPNILQDYPNYKIAGYDKIYEKYWKATPVTLLKEESVSTRTSSTSHGNDENDKIIAYLINQFRINCPLTYSIIKEEESVGNATNGFISRLIPGSVINPHVGYTNKYMRIHFGLVCDPECKITVGNDTKAWEEGKILAFNDGDKHSVIHNGTNERIILSLDVPVKYLRKYIVNVLG